MFCMINTIICIDIYYTIDCTKYITENKHHDMTVGLVQWLWLFRKKTQIKIHRSSLGYKNQSFKLRCITTDSLNRVLTADFYKDCIHLLDQNGMFLCYIGYCNLQVLYGDNRDNLFMYEYIGGIRSVLKIKFSILQRHRTLWQQR